MQGPLPVFFPYLALMSRKIRTFKKGFHDIIELCNEIDNELFQRSVSAIFEEMETFDSDDDIERGLSLLDELVIHLNDMDEDIVEPYCDTIAEINDLVEELIDEAGSS